MYDFLKLIFIFLLLFIGNCASTKTGRFQILDNRVQHAHLIKESNELAIDYVVYITKNIQSVKIYYDIWNKEKKQWVRLDYVFYNDVPKHIRKKAKFNVGVVDKFAVNEKTGLIRVNIMASNKPFNEIGHGVVVMNTDTINLEKTYGLFIK